jgi:outer membrane protein OmpA-like peptidoglycan-associated protein/tetratricopeptide (TPR) repeat protein
MKKGIAYILVFLGLAVAGMAQSGKTHHPAAYFKNAEKEFSNQRYTYAIAFYRASLKSGRTNDSLALLHLAECYWRIKNYDSAVIYYKQYESRYAPLFTTHQRLAELSATLGNYAEAAENYKTLLKDPALRSERMMKEKWTGFSNTVPFLRDSLDYAVRLLKLNTRQQDFSPQFFQRGMVFVSNRYSRREGERQFGWDGLPYAGIYLVKDTAALYLADSIPGRSAWVLNASIKANDDFTDRTSNDNDIINILRAKGDYKGDIYRLARFSDELTTRYNYGPLCFTKDGKTVYFTRNSKKAYEGRYNLEICKAVMDDGSWSNINVMPFIQPAYDFYHPALSEDGTRLYFCSNKPDGYGGSDIYYVHLAAEADQTGIFNLGETINTAGDELFPTMKNDTLYFGSDGLAGLGGLDMYRSTAGAGGNRWTRPVNLGYPLNTSFDDFGIIFNEKGNKGFFSSNRLGSDDIYMFRHDPFVMNMRGTVYNRSTLRRLDKAAVVVSVMEGGKAVPVDTIVTDLTGNFSFKAKPYRDYTLYTTREGFSEEKISIPSPSVKEPEIRLNDVLLTPLIVPVQGQQPEKDTDGDAIVDSKDKCPTKKGIRENGGCPDIQKRLNELAKMVFFDTDKSDILQKSLNPLNEVVAILKEYPNTTLEIEGHTDSRASATHNKALSQRRANSVKAYLMSKGLTEARFTTVIGYGLEKPIATNATSEGRAMNRRVQLKATFVQ